MSTISMETKTIATQATLFSCASPVTEKKLGGSGVRDYERLEIEEFGRALLETGDLDPVYVALNQLNLPVEQLKRWLLAYWFFYHCGVACKLSEFEGDDFWGAAMFRIEVKTTPRGTERRHFRGEKAEQAVDWFAKTYKKPEDAVDYASDGTLWGGKTFNGVSKRVQEWPEFGPWIAFKVADMLERCLGIPIDFSDCDLLSFYEEPRKAAEILAKRRGLADGHAALGHLAFWMEGFGAPPDKARNLNIQELETILCKWKSHLNGHYPIGKDTNEIRHALTNWGPLAERLKDCLPRHS